MTTWNLKTGVTVENSASLPLDLVYVNLLSLNKLKDSIVDWLFKRTPECGDPRPQYVRHPHQARAGTSTATIPFIFGRTVFYIPRWSIQYLHSSWTYSCNNQFFQFPPTTTVVGKGMFYSRLINDLSVKQCAGRVGSCNLQPTLPLLLCGHNNCNAFEFKNLTHNSVNERTSVSFFFKRKPKRKPTREKHTKNSSLSVSMTQLLRLSGSALPWSSFPCSSNLDMNNRRVLW